MAQPCPQEILPQGGNVPLANTIQTIVHYVSMIPFIQDWETFGSERTDVWCTSSEFLELGAGDWEEHAILLCNFFNHLDQSRGSAHTSYVVLGRGLPEGDTVYTVRINNNTGSNDAKAVLWNASTGRGYECNDSLCPMTHVDEVIGSDNVWINVQPHLHPSRISWDFTDSKCWKPLFSQNPTSKNRIPAEGLTYVNTHQLQHLNASAVIAATIERDLQQTLKGHFKLWRQEAEKGQKTFTSWDNSVSQALKSLLDAFESAKLQADGFSEDCKFHTNAIRFI